MERKPAPLFTDMPFRLPTLISSLPIPVEKSECGKRKVKGFMDIYSWLPLASGGGSMGEAMEQFVLQLGGLFFRRWLHLPDVLGELASGMLIGPFALGAMDLPGIGPLFPHSGEIISVSEPLYGLATMASVLLLFIAGLETNLKLFLRYSVAGVVVGLGGVIIAFGVGAWCAVLFGVSEHMFDPSAMFLGVIATATSVGITARILAERRKTDSPEGVTIMAAAVLDDVLGIVLLAIVVGVAQMGDASEHIPWGNIGIVAGKAFGFWLICSAVGIAIAGRISKLLKQVKSPAAMTSLAFGMALLLAALSERSGLAMIIGAYIMGLSLSTTDLAQFLQEQLKSMYDLIVPVFFCVMGMLVDFAAMGEVLVMGLVYTLLATISKVLGCGLPAMLAGFNFRGGLRVGLGMLPRGEVALIIAGMGLSLGIIEPGIFGVSIMMTVLTTLIAPPLLIAMFRHGSGVRNEREDIDQNEIAVKLSFPSEDVAEFVMSRLIRAFRREEFFVHTLHDVNRAYQVRKDKLAFSFTQERGDIQLLMTPASNAVVRFIVLEELLAMEDVFESCKKIKDIQTMGSDLLSGLYK
jgi:Kef-type K+ transport system membrane component KefB